MTSSIKNTVFSFTATAFIATLTVFALSGCGDSESQSPRQVENHDGSRTAEGWLSDDAPGAETRRRRRCRSDEDCPLPDICRECDDGSSVCLEVSCERRRCVYGFPHCEVPYEPCANKTCGDTCTLCAPDDPDCFETDVIKFCHADGTCSPTPPCCDGVDASCAAVLCPIDTRCKQGQCIPIEPVFCGGFAGIPCPGAGECRDDPSDDCDPEHGGADCGGVCVCTIEAICIEGHHFDNDPAVCACVPDTCPGEERLCGSRGLPPCNDNEWCDFPTSSMCGAADQPGVCRVRPEFCLEIFDPVCGCDGMTYGNECEAHAAGVDVSSEGPC